MYTGGYQIVSFGGTNITSLNSPQVQLNTKPYQLIEGTSKAILVSDVVIDTKSYHDLFVQPHILNSNYVFDFADYTITLTADNKVSVKEIEE